MTARKPKKFKVSDGYSVGDFLHYGFDNVAAAELLLKTNARYFDSGGYLAHLGLELLLKAWHLHVFGEFEGGHLIDELWKKLVEYDKKLHLDKKSAESLIRIDAYFSLRYPKPAMPQEIGDDDLPGILKLQAVICAQMPVEMHNIIATLSGVRKGGRVLMEKPVES
jgi:HEPN domain-containing protein